ncbi:hypothetical protein [Cystobacter ferrugineus]|nr:hypothetical protein [Cystobacter ferrugineus]
MICPCVGAEQAEGIGVDTTRHLGKALTFEQFPGDVARRVGDQREPRL